MTDLSDSFDPIRAQPLVAQKPARSQESGPITEADTPSLEEGVRDAGSPAPVAVESNEPRPPYTRATDDASAATRADEQVDDVGEELEPEYAEDRADGTAQQAPEKEDPFTRFTRGSIYDARIVEVRSTGLKVDVDGVVGFIKREEIGENTPIESFELGQEVRVFILGVDHVGRNLDISILKARAGLDAATMAMRDGTVVPAIVSRVEEDAAYALVPGGLEARIDIADLAEDGDGHAGNAVALSEVIPLKIVAVNDPEHGVAANLLDAFEDAESAGWEFDESDRVAHLPADAEATVALLSGEAAKRGIRFGSLRRDGSGDPDSVWDELQRRFDRAEVFEARVTGSNMGGLLVDIDGVEAFVPLRHISEIRGGKEQAIAQLPAYEGRYLQFKVIEVDRSRNWAILSKWTEQKDRLLDKLQEGEIRSGRITGIEPFGVFVDLGGADALAHISELSWGEVGDPNDLFELDQKMQVFVLHIDEESDRIRVSVKRADSGPWQDATRSLEVGQCLPAVVEMTIDKGVFVRLFGPVEGYVKTAEMVDWEADDAGDLVQPGDMIPVQIIEIDREMCQVSLSMRRARPVAEADGWRFDERGLVTHVPDHVDLMHKDRTIATRSEVGTSDEGPATKGDSGVRVDVAWNELQRRLDEGEVFEEQVTGSNKGGLLVNVEGVNTFVPLSQIVEITGDREQAISQLPTYEGRYLRFKVIEVNRRRNRVILSERAAHEALREEARERLLDELHEGEIRNGKITSIRPFGVFVDLGGADGLAHLSELSWERDVNPMEMFRIGQTVDVFIARIDRESKKIGLSIRRAAPEEWDEAVAKLSVGQVVAATVTKLVTFGAFARIEGPVEGLVHISELVDRQLTHPRDVVEEGMVIPVKIVRIDQEQRRIGLSLKQAREEAEQAGWVFNGDGGVERGPNDSDGESDAPETALAAAFRRAVVEGEGNDEGQPG